MNTFEIICFCLLLVAKRIASSVLLFFFLHRFAVSWIRRNNNTGNSTIVHNERKSQLIFQIIIIFCFVLFWFSIKNIRNRWLVLIGLLRLASLLMSLSTTCPFSHLVSNKNKNHTQKRIQYIYNSPCTLFPRCFHTFTSLHRYSWMGSRPFLFFFFL